MTEIDIPQRSKEWFELRQTLLLTASRFGDALGLGLGKPYDFLVSLVSDDPVYDRRQVTDEARHGLTLEPIIDEAYQILTGHVTQRSGFWMPDGDNILHDVAGASPDAKVYDGEDPGRIIGLAEYKAPVYKMYAARGRQRHGVPRRYMAQVQAQMAICKQPWCDFMAVCTKTKSIMLQRVYFHNVYWTSIATSIKHFCWVLQRAFDRKAKGLEPLNFPAARNMETLPVRDTLYPGENNISVENLILDAKPGVYKTLRGTFSYDFLMGSC